MSIGSACSWTEVQKEKIVGEPKALTITAEMQLIGCMLDQSKELSAVFKSITQLKVSH